MPLHIDSYTTTAGSAFPTADVVKAIKEAIIVEDLDKKPESSLRIQNFGDYYPLFITGTYPSEAKIPPFAHPISILNIRGKNFISTDLRLYLKKDTGNGFESRISNKIDYDFAVTRGLLNLFWVSGRASEFTSGFQFSAKVFSDWVTQTLSPLGIEAHEQVLVQIAALAYYYAQCQDSVMYIENNKQVVVDWIYSLTGHDALGIAKVLDRMKPMGEFNHFIENLKLILDNIRMQKMNAGSFLALIRSSWYGTNAAQVLQVCVEHPPTWTAIVHHTLASKSYQKCAIGQIALNAAKRGGADGFMRHYSDKFSGSLRMESVGKAPTQDDYDYDGLKMSMEASGQMPILAT